MMRITLRLVTLLFLAGVMGACASKKKGGEQGPVGEASPEANITSQQMNFDAMGSDSGTIQGLQTIHFEYDQANLSADARKGLAQNADWIKNNSGVTIQIEGHCDARGSVEYNLALGERRAKATKSYLVSLGIDGKRLSIISYGKEKPVASGDSEDSYSKNRRANFVPLPK